MKCTNDIFSVIKTPNCDCNCNCGDKRNDQVGITGIPLVLNIYRGQEFELVIDNLNDKAKTLLFKCNAFTKNFTYDKIGSNWILNLSASETSSLIPNTYTYKVYKDNKFWYTGTLNIRDSEYYTSGIGQIRYELQLLTNKVDELAKSNEEIKQLANDAISKAEEAIDRLGEATDKINDSLDKIEANSLSIQNNATAIESLKDRVESLENIHATKPEIEALCNEVYEL